jgi:hypothetical protein
MDFRQVLMAAATQGGGAAAAPSYSAEALALFARMAPAPDATRKGIINTLILALKTGATSATNIWAKLDVLYVLAADTEANSLLEWKGNVAYNGVKNGVPTFTADRGFVSVGNDYIQTNYAPGTVSLGMGLNDAHIGCYITAGAGTSPDLGGGSTGNRLTVTLINLNAGGGVVAFTPAATVPGHFVGNRNAVDELIAYRNAAGGAPNVNPTTTMTITPFTILTLSTGGTGSGNTGSICHMGRGLNAAELTDAKAAFAAYLTAIGSPA